MRKFPHIRVLFGTAFLATSCTLLHSTSNAHDDHSHGHSHATKGKSQSSRTWTFRDTGAHLHGAYLTSKDGVVKLQRDDGNQASLEIAKLSDADQKWIESRVSEVRKLNEQTKPAPILISYASESEPAAPPAMAACFDPFAKLKSITYRADDRFLYVESNGMPDHRMMVGITAWQQQVPIPQRYFGENAWRIPLSPVEAKQPLSAKSHFFRGAIALAANGVPIFNPIKNDGRTDTFLAGELDEFGGHCGRADDYHYHIAPTHLQKVVGEGNPIAYALDGYPIYGLTEPDGKPVDKLDAFNGHHTDSLGYHYHATKGYPYLNGGFHGEVVERDGQVDPQPRANSFREALPPLKGAKIIGFEEPESNRYVLTYEIQGRKGTVSYLLGNDGTAQFTYTDPNGAVRNENYQTMRRNGGGGGGGGRGENQNNNQPPPERGRDRNGPRNNQPERTPPPRRNDPPAREQPPKGSFSASSAAIQPNGLIDVAYTCDGKSIAPPVEWKGAPEGTKAFVVSLWHTAPDQEKSYWLVYNIPADVSGIPENKKPEGTVGLNDKRKAEYDPMCSKGPGRKTYHLTVYALSEKLNVAPNKANRSTIVEAMKSVTLGQTTLDFDYERKGK